MTEKLYEQDSMLKSCLATVLSCAEDKRGYAVVLDRTCLLYTSDAADE